MTQEMDSLYIIMPAYNEEANIRDVVNDWYPVVERHNGGGRSRLVVIDDGSRDNTYRILEECRRDRPLLEVITRENSGHGATVLYGYRYALEHRADYIFQTDSDGQTLPGEFGEFWKRRRGYDMVIGHRNKREDGISRIIVTKVLKLVIGLCFGVNVRDANTPYRLMKREPLERYIDLIPKDFNLSNVLLSVIFVKKGCSVRFVPVTFRPRQGGKNSINIRKIIGIGRKAVRDFREISKTI